MCELLDAVILYKKTRDKANECPNLILSSGKTDEARKIMRDHEAARERMYKIAGLI